MKIFIVSSSIRNFKLGRTTISYSIDGKQMEIFSIRTPRVSRGQGEATKALQALLEQADQQHLEVKLIASPLDKATKLDKLVRFYQKHGFEVTGERANAAGDPIMARPAR